MTKSELIRRMARGVGLCDEWYGAWGEASDDEMVEMFVRGQDFCIEHDFPPIDVALYYFSEEVRHRHGIYINESFSATNPPIIIALGNSKGTITVTDHNVTMIYARHNSQLSISAHNTARVFLRLYNTAQAETKSTHQAKIFKYRR